MIARNGGVSFFPLPARCRSTSICLPQIFRAAGSRQARGSCWPAATACVSAPTGRAGSSISGDVMCFVFTSLTPFTSSGSAMWRRQLRNRAADALASNFYARGMPQSSKSGFQLRSTSIRSICPSKAMVARVWYGSSCHEAKGRNTLHEVGQDKTARGVFQAAGACL
jgi:hypothetical protein